MLWDIFRFRRGPPGEVIPKGKSTIFKLPSTTPSVLTDSEKEERRLAMARAAASRGSTNAWEKKSSGKADKKDPLACNNSTDSDASSISEETLQTINRVKQREAQMVIEMGYNPFKPVMASTTNTGSSTISAAANVPPIKSPIPSIPPPRPPSGIAPDYMSALTNVPTPATTADQWTETHEQLVEELFDEALSLLLSMQGQNSDANTAVTVCITTVLKMLENLLSNPQDPKFRSIRIQNPNFQSKVYQIPGGKQLFIAAGFQLYTNSIQDADSISDDSYLKHSMAFKPQKMLVYVVNRLQLIKQEL